MKRDDLQKFIKYGKDELPDEYKILCMDLEPEYDSLIVRLLIQLRYLMMRSE